MSGVEPPDDKLGNFTATLIWDPTKLIYIGNSGHQSGFSGVIDDTNADTGQLMLTGTSQIGVSGAFAVLMVIFDLGGSGTSPLDLEYSAMASALQFTDSLAILTVTDGECVVAHVHRDAVALCDAFGHGHARSGRRGTSAACVSARDREGDGFSADE